MSEKIIGKICIKPRDVSIEENQKIADQLRIHIETMCEYKAYSYWTQSLRSKLTNYRGKYRLYAMSKVSENIRHSTNTNYGELLIYRGPYIGLNNEILEEALHRMGLDDLDNELAMDKDHKRRYVVKINTDALKNNRSVIDKQKVLFEEFYAFEKTVDAIVSEERFIVAAICWMRDNLHYHRQYLSAYTRAKELFVKSSTCGNFPRSFDYMGVVFHWQDVMMISCKTARLTAYLLNKDVSLYDRFMLLVAEIREEIDKYRPVLLLDDYDFEKVDGVEE